MNQTHTIPTGKNNYSKSEIFEMFKGVAKNRVRNLMNTVIVEFLNCNIEEARQYRSVSNGIMLVVKDRLGCILTDNEEEIINRFYQRKKAV